MSKKNIDNIVAARDAKLKRKSERKRMEPLQKLLNKKSPKCRQCVGSILLQNDAVKEEIFNTITEINALASEIKNLSDNEVSVLIDSL